MSWGLFSYPNAKSEVNERIVYCLLFIFLLFSSGQDLTMLGQLTVAIAFLFVVFQHSEGRFFDEVPVNIFFHYFHYFHW